MHLNTIDFGLKQVEKIGDKPVWGLHIREGALFDLIDLSVAQEMKYSAMLK